jgi:hypothetical protein
MVSILAWVLIAMGALIGLACLVRLAGDRFRPRIAQADARSRAWLNFRTGVLSCNVGASILGWQAKNHAVEWVTEVLGCIIVILAFVLWARSRIATGAAGNAAKNAR